MQTLYGGGAFLGGGGGGQQHLHQQQQQHFYDWEQYLKEQHFLATLESHCAGAAAAAAGAPSSLPSAKAAGLFE